MFFNVFRAALLALFLLASQVVAQSSSQVDYQQWESFATQAEEALDDSATSDDRLTSIRQNAARWRSEFSAAQNTNAARIDTVRSQIEALGPAPAEGATEASDVADRRKALNDQLSELQAPGITATEALSRANSIIARADAIQSERVAEEIVTVTPSPLLPSSWAAAGADLKAVWDGLSSELKEGFSGNQLRDNILQVLAYVLGGIILLTFGRRIVDMLPARLGDRAAGDAKAVVAFVVSLGQILLPMIGIYLIINGLDMAGLFGPWLRPLMLSISLGAFAFFSGRWLVRILFSARPIAYPTLNVPSNVRAFARFYGTGMAITLAWHIILSSSMLPLAGYVRSDDAPPQIPYEFSDAGAGVIHFVLMLIGSFFLFQFANILRRMTRYDGTDSPPFRTRVLSLFGRILRVLIFIVLAFAMLGFINFANATFWALIETLALIGLLVLVQDFVADLYALLRRGKEGARDSLVPMVIGFILIIASLPLFALIWGVTPAELAEARTRILAGVSVGGIKLSPGGILTFLIVFTLGYLATRWIQSAMRTAVLPRTKLDSGAQNAMVSGLGYIGIFLAAVFAITSAGIDLSSLAIVAGALSVGIGFGLQTIVQNFVSGIILLIERPISVGDWVEAGGQQGIVQDISVRSTRIKTFDQTDVIVPNSDLVSQTVTNWTRGNSRGRIIVPVGVAYGSDTRRVTDILREIVEDQPTVLIDPPPAVLLTGFGADSLDFEVRAILSDISGGIGVASEIRHRIVERFTEEGIEIPFAQRDIWLRNPETLFGANAKEPPKEGADKPAAPAEADGKPDTHEIADIRSVGEFPDNDGGGDGDGGDGDST